MFQLNLFILLNILSLIVYNSTYNDITFYFTALLLIFILLSVF